MSLVALQPHPTVCASKWLWTGQPLEGAPQGEREGAPDLRTGRRLADLQPVLQPVTPTCQSQWAGLSPRPAARGPSPAWGHCPSLTLTLLQVVLVGPFICCDKSCRDQSASLSSVSHVSRGTQTVRSVVARRPALRLAGACGLCCGPRGVASCRSPQQSCPATPSRLTCSVCLQAGSSLPWAGDSDGHLLQTQMCEDRRAVSRGSDRLPTSHLSPLLLPAAAPDWSLESQLRPGPWGQPRGATPGQPWRTAAAAQAWHLHTGTRLSVRVPHGVLACALHWTKR